MATSASRSATLPGPLSNESQKSGPYVRLGLDWGKTGALLAVLQGRPDVAMLDGELRERGGVAAALKALLA